MTGLPCFRRPLRRFDADSHDEPVDPHERDHRCAGRDRVPLGDRDGRDDAVEGRLDREVGLAGTRFLQGVERRFSVGDGLIGLGQLVLGREMLPEKLGDAGAFDLRRLQRRFRLAVAAERRFGDAEFEQGLSGLDRFARRHVEPQNPALALQADRHAAVERRTGRPVGGDDIGQTAPTRRHGRDEDATLFGR